MLKRRPTGWLVLAITMAVLAVMSVVGGVWGANNGDLLVLLAVPVNLLLCYWLGVGAWRRTDELPLS